MRPGTLDTKRHSLLHQPRLRPGPGLESGDDHDDDIDDDDIDDNPALAWSQVRDCPLIKQ